LRQRHLGRLAARAGIRHALRTARIEQMNVRVDDGDGIGGKNRGAKNRDGGDRRRPRQKPAPLHQCKSTLVARQLPASATYSALGLRQSMALTLPKSLGPLPAWPNLPTTVPFSSSL